MLPSPDTSFQPVLAALFSQAPAPEPALCRIAATRAAQWVGPALADWLWRRAGLDSGLDREAVQAAGLYCRLNHHRQRYWLRKIAGAGIPVVCLKGAATGVALYGDHAFVRVKGDLDLLVQQADRARLWDFLRETGFQFHYSSVRPWGFWTDDSLQPLMSADGMTNIDIHIYPDSWPAHLGLTTEAVMASASTIVLDDGTPVSVPAPEHMMCVAITNFAKDRFAGVAFSQMVDAGLLIGTSNTDFDWDAVDLIARRGRFGTAALVMARVLNQCLGLRDVPSRPIGWGLSRWVVARLEEDIGALWQRPERLRDVVLREWTLYPAQARFRAWRRLTGLIRPRSGMLK